MRKSNKKVVIELHNLGKDYLINREKQTFVENILKRRSREKFTSLRNLNLSIFKREKVGIIGLNGAGKTTLLKVIAGITNPDLGSIKTKGKIVSLISLDAGFNLELSGRENIFLNGMIIGMDRKTIERRMKKIIGFADIGEFIDMPLYTYSSGMKLRLGFSIAINSDFDTLVLDESLAVGDKVFQHRVFHKILGLSKRGKTLILASQDLETISKFYNRVIWMHKGSVKMDGSAKKVIKSYKDWTDEFYKRTRKK